MQYHKVINLISQHLGDDLITTAEMLGYIDRVIDDINTQLDANFPTFTDYQGGTYNDFLDYTPIPDKYIRTVIVPGAALKYYITDEEGNQAAVKYEEDYRQGLFYMLRDYSQKVPVEYRNKDGEGGIDTPEFESGLEVCFRGGLY